LARIGPFGTQEEEPEEATEASPLEAAVTPPRRPMPEVVFRREDIRGYDVADADVVLLHTASLEAETVAAILPRLACMRAGRFARIPRLSTPRLSTPRRSHFVCA
jgi:hypothetical protein